MESTNLGRSASRPVPKPQNSLGVSCITVVDHEYPSEVSRMAPAGATTDPHNIFCDSLLFVQRKGESPAVSEEPLSTVSLQEITTFPEYGSIPKTYFEYAQRTLSTLVLAGTFMAGVEAQLLSLIFSAADVPMRTIAIGFAVSALLSTAFVAMYCAVTYIWLRQEWRHKTHCFDEWVAGSLAMMMIWCAVFLVIGVYAGFFAVIFFLFVAAPRVIAIISAGIFAICGVGPMSWGFYYWYGLYRGWLVWTPHEDGSFPHRRQASNV